MAGKDWLSARRAEVASDRILDAAGKLFTDTDVSSVGMNEIARVAGCSRATLYRYFENREALHTAYVHREAYRLYQQMGDLIDGIDDPRQRLVAGLTASLRLVRESPPLSAWFATTGSPIGAEMAEQSEVIQALSSAFLLSLRPDETACGEAPRPLAGTGTHLAADLPRPRSGRRARHARGVRGAARMPNPCVATSQPHDGCSCAELRLGKHYSGSARGGFAVGQQCRRRPAARNYRRPDDTGQLYGNCLNGWRHPTPALQTQYHGSDDLWRAQWGSAEPPGGYVGGRPARPHSIASRQQRCSFGANGVDVGHDHAFRHTSNGGPEEVGADPCVTNPVQQGFCSSVRSSVGEAPKRATALLVDEPVHVDGPRRRLTGALHHVPAIRVELMSQVFRHHRPVPLGVFGGPRLAPATDPR